MDNTTVHYWIEAIGWLASILTVGTYAMNTMLPLRILAIGSSLCFFAYGFALQLWPLLAMEMLLLPINCYRLWQIVSLRGKLAAPERARRPDFSVIRTYGKSRRVAAGSVIFRRGDPVDQLYYIGSGKVLIEELGIEIEGGEIFGEIAFFTDAATRTATARCTEDAQLYEIDEKRFMRLQFEDPSFGLSVMRTVTRRIAENGSWPVGLSGGGAVADGAGGGASFTQS
ncbi:cyclic nucleotide-binding domain-containing protein [Roseibacterium sp. SDUM158017]|uniref:cyclic nucleotide-binding domain-containing protein n=1 Tax=Roseicyclus salinarum TaxID=3036773 RepID=UPI00241541B0|nr:cyclic nucleotide-binding domain-containing protein [Roseibacterium sp. SDUM158017]MDG4649890.1 cyclic nucleotide-binding domain-containing protein [Roseibacterium sp. SDUM158017]